MRPSVFRLQQRIQRYVKHFRKSENLNVGYKAFAAFDALNGVLVDVDAHELHAVCQFSLRNTQLHAKARDVRAAYIVSSVTGFVDKHAIPHFDIWCLSLRKLYVTLLDVMTYSECQIWIGRG